jgi:hypothetical protein
MRAELVNSGWAFRVASASPAQAFLRDQVVDLARGRGTVMGVLDGVILASMGVLVVFFASVAVMDWLDARAEARREDQRPDAQVIQHPQNSAKVNPAA